MSTAITPFTIAIPDADVQDLRERLTRTRRPASDPGAAWQRGVPTDYLTELTEAWAGDYDWRAAEAALNAYPHATTEIDGQTIHFVHVRSDEPDATPLVLLHGYPGSFVDYIELIGPLTRSRGPWRRPVPRVPRRDPVAARLRLLDAGRRRGLGE